MSLRKASWAGSSPSEPTRQPPPPTTRNPKMDLSNLTHPSQSYRDYTTSQRRERFERPEGPRESRQTHYTSPQPYTSASGVPHAGRFERFGSARHVGDEESTDSSGPSPPPSHSSLSPVGEYLSNGLYNTEYHSGHYSTASRYGSSSTATTPSSASPPRFESLSQPDTGRNGASGRRPSTVRSATIYHRDLTRCPESERHFGSARSGRYFCTFVEHETNRPCDKWQDGYTTWYDLARHADSEHGPEEVELLERGVIDFERAQWIKSEKQLAAIKVTVRSMVCRDCGTCFASNRVDSMERHVKKGACERVQERLRAKSSQYAATVHKRKGAKTAVQHTRR